MPKCFKCGKKGFFLKLSNKGFCAECERAIIRRKEVQYRDDHPDFVPSTQTAVLTKPKTANEDYLTGLSGPWFDGERDKQFLSLQAHYYKRLEEIEADYVVLTNAPSLNLESCERFGKKCLDAMVSFQMLVPLWKKYDRGVPYSSPPFKRLAMIREKQGDYEGAALACVQQLRLGVDGDGTKGGMRGRLARMVKKGNLYENEEVMKEISTYLEVE